MCNDTLYSNTYKTGTGNFIHVLIFNVFWGSMQQGLINVFYIAFTSRKYAYLFSWQELDIKEASIFHLSLNMRLELTTPNFNMALNHKLMFFGFVFCLCHWSNKLSVSVSQLKWIVVCVWTKSVWLFPPAFCLGWIVYLSQGWLILIFQMKNCTLSHLIQ